MSTHDLLDKLDGIQAVNRMDGITVYPESVSRLHRGLGGVNNKVLTQLVEIIFELNSIFHGRFMQTICYHDVS